MEPKMIISQKVELAQQLLQGEFDAAVINTIKGILKEKNSVQDDINKRAETLIDLDKTLADLDRATLETHFVADSSFGLSGDKGEKIVISKKDLSKHNGNSYGR